MAPRRRRYPSLRRQRHAKRQWLYRRSSHYPRFPSWNKSSQRPHENPRKRKQSSNTTKSTKTSFSYQQPASLRSRYGAVLVYQTAGLVIIITPNGLALRSAPQAAFPRPCPRSRGVNRLRIHLTTMSMDMISRLHLMRIWDWVGVCLGRNKDCDLPVVKDWRTSRWTLRRRRNEILSGGNPLAMHIGIM